MTQQKLHTPEDRMITGLFDRKSVYRKALLSFLSSEPISS